MSPVPPLVAPAEALSPAELSRYDRHLLLPEIGLPGQLRLKNARVLVVGAGGLGSPALAYLAAAGVGVLGVVDDDVVSASNLQRQILHGVADVGRLKVDSAREAVAAWNPHVEVRTHPVRVTATNALELVTGYDLVLDGTDNFATRYLLNDACALRGKPYVWASILRFDGQVSVFWAGHGPCYRCLFPAPPPPGSVPSCAEGGVLGVLCAAVGAAQATEVVKLITGAGESLLGRLQLHDALAASWDTLPVAADPGCALCGEQPTITGLVEIGAAVEPGGEGEPGEGVSPETLRAMLSEREAGRRRFRLLDVREPHEWEVARIPGAELVPGGEVSEQIGPAPDPEEPLVLYCRSGQRSAAALRRLRERGHQDLLHLEGGLQAWQASAGG